MEKTTRDNLVRGRIGMTWFKQRQHCKNFAGKCGVCFKFKGIKARPPLGPSLLRVAISIRPFQHVSVDSLGHVSVTTHGASTEKVYPLSMVDIDKGATHFEIMASLEDKEARRMLTVRQGSMRKIKEEEMATELSAGFRHTKCLKRK